jgi:hypothetical protein
MSAEPYFGSRQEQEIFLSPTNPDWHPHPQLPSQMVQGSVSLGRKRTGHEADHFPPPTGDAVGRVA